MTEPAAFSRDRWVDIGHDVSIDLVRFGGEVVGVDYHHPRPDGGRCAGFVYLDTPQVREEFAPPVSWTVESANPLTLSPSLLCRHCGHHGFVRDGQWVPA